MSNKIKWAAKKTWNKVECMQEGEKMCMFQDKPLLSNTHAFLEVQKLFNNH